MELHTKPIDKSDQRYIDYLKTTDNPTWIGYENYCGELYEKETNERLIKYAKRNEAFLKKVNHIETFIWLQKYMKNKPSAMNREEVGDIVMNATLTMMGCYNSLFMELTRDELDEGALIYFLNRINKQKQILNQ